MGPTILQPVTGGRAPVDRVSSASADMSAVVIVRASIRRAASRSRGTAQRRRRRSGRQRASRGDALGSYRARSRAARRSSRGRLDGIDAPITGAARRIEPSASWYAEHVTRSSPLAQQHEPVATVRGTEPRPRATGDGRRLHRCDLPTSIGDVVHPVFSVDDQGRVCGRIRQQVDPSVTCAGRRARPRGRPAIRRPQPSAECSRAIVRRDRDRRRVRETNVARRARCRRRGRWRSAITSPGSGSRRPASIIAIIERRGARIARRASARATSRSVRARDSRQARTGYRIRERVTCAGTHASAAPGLDGRDCARRTRQAARPRALGRLRGPGPRRADLD